MIEYKNNYFEGERIIYGLNDATLDGITFGNGESPLKETKNINLKNSISNGNIHFGMLKI